MNKNVALIPKWRIWSNDLQIVSVLGFGTKIIWVVQNYASCNLEILSGALLLDSGIFRNSYFMLDLDYHWNSPISAVS